MTSDEFFQTDARVALGVSKTLPPDRFPGLFCAISAIHPFNYLIEHDPVVTAARPRGTGGTNDF